MITRTHGLRPRVAWSYAIINVFLVAAIYALPSYHVYLWGLLGLGSAAAIVVGIACNRPDHRSAWVVIALGVTVFALGDITYDVLTKYLHEVNPYPSLADVFYLATYPLLAARLTAISIAIANRRVFISFLLGKLSWHRLPGASGEFYSTSPCRLDNKMRKIAGAEREVAIGMPWVTAIQQPRTPPQRYS